MLTEKQKKILFNGRTLAGDFRRGFWKKDEFESFAGKKPDLPMQDYKAFLWYDGSVAFYISGDGVMVINKHHQGNQDVMGVADVIKLLNGMSQTETQDLGGRVVVRASTMMDRLVL